MNAKYSALVSLLSTATATFPMASQPPMPIPNESSGLVSPLSARTSMRTMGIYVGELQELWQFPSDHLPIGMSFRDIQIASWNVLDVEYMHWVIEKNSQGLSRSMIADTHVYIGDSKLTVRDKIIVDRILEMMDSPQHILSLQECSQPFLQELASRLPVHMKLIAQDGNAVLIDETQFRIVSAQAIAGAFSERPLQSFQDLTIECLGTGEKMRLVNAHLPGNLTGPARYEFGKYLTAIAMESSIPLIAMGDMNFNELEMSDAIAQNAPATAFYIRSPYCTNIDPQTRFSKAIDHFIVFNAEPSELMCKKPNELLANLEHTAKLLNKS